ncbi:tetratricopeptide repeat protein [Roseivivax sp. GX 12232]|uniref:tetratricopeptide repeat protein n=1 Tax=Roseivivax sp. GX 12232 TaxID=2900547 RepID=UPI001E61C5A4|nr:tetratricopeptide repeat protein [Roseivivax sp. GX 12232]
MLAFSLPSLGQAEGGSERAAELLRDLGAAETPAEARRLERELELEWSKSGSAAMDLLLRRGRDALEVQELDRAVEHLRALTDHAPGFAEGWHTLAQAYYAQDRLGLSADALERTLALNPNHYGALQGLGAIFEHLGDAQRAYRAYDAADALRPFDERVTNALTRLDLLANGYRL